MKKGLTIALLMVAMVALAASASAVAPVIQDLPAVIIGDAGNTVTEGTTVQRLFKYDNVFNLAAPGVIDRASATTDTLGANLKVFYVIDSGSPQLRASNTNQLVAPMTGPELTALTTVGTEPGGKKVNATGNPWMSLIQNIQSPGKTAPVNARTATAAANGATSQVLVAAGINKAVVTLYAADILTTANGQSLVGSGSFVVYTFAGYDDNYSPAARQYTAALTGSAGNLGARGGWYLNLHGNLPGGLVDGKATTTATGVGFQGTATFATGVTQCFTTWEHTNKNGFDYAATVVAPAVNMTGKIYRAQMNLTGNGTEAQLCPGFRFLYTSLFFNHIGGFQVLTPQGGSGVAEVSEGNHPWAAHPVNVAMYWAVPTDMVGYADGGILTTLNAGRDWRDYYIMFDEMQLEAGDIGSLIMESLTIDKILRPTDTIPLIQWGSITRNGATTSGKKFNQSGFVWLVGTSDLGTGDGLGVASVAADSVSLRMSSNPGVTSVFQQVAPQPDAVGFPKWSDGKLMRSSYNLSSSDAARSPQVRNLLIPYVKGYWAMGNAIWVELINPMNCQFRYTPATYPYLAGSPKTTGSLWESYYYSMKGLSTGTDSALTTAIDINAPKPTTTTGYPRNGGWNVPNATVQIKGHALEVLN